MSDLATTQQTEKMAKAVHDLLGEGKCPWTMPQLALIRERTPQEVDKASFLAFLHTAAKNDLDPLTNDIYAVAYFDKSEGRHKTSIITGIGGLRKTAQRTGRYMGMTAPIYFDSDGKPHEVWIGKDVPHAVKIGVWAKDAKEPTWAVVLMSEFRGRNGQWGFKPVHMITKVAEAHALRKVFPECNGLYEEAEEDAIVGRRFVDNEAELKAPADLGLGEPAPEPQPEPVPFTPKPQVVADVAAAPVELPKMPIDPSEFSEAFFQACDRRGFDEFAALWLIGGLCRKHGAKDITYTTTAQRSEAWVKLHRGELDRFKTPEGRKKKEPTNG